MSSVLKVALAAACVAWAGAGEPRVTLEIVARGGLAPTASQQWYQALSKLGISGLRIRADDVGGEMAVTETGTKAAPAYKVVGILAADNTLHLPGGTFSVRDTAGLRKWLDNLRDGGAEGVTQKRSVFGLLPRELRAVNEDLKRPLGISTKGMSAAAAVGQIAGGLTIPMTFEPGAQRALAEVELQDDLGKLSRGTALAAILRPAGLVLRPARSGGRLEYRVERPQAGEQVWPIGWPPKGRRSETLPALYEMLNVEIKEIPVSQALAAIEARLEVPLVFDRNAMALYNVDPAATPADVPEKRMSYSQVLRKVLSQGKLRYELRVDEAEKPFLWITTVKRAP